MTKNKQTYTYEYPRPSVTADTVAFGHDETLGLCVLLIKRRNDPFKNYWALPGGYLEMNETTSECARRELVEETGLLVHVKSCHQSDRSGDKENTGTENGTLIPFFEEVGCFSDIDRDPRGRVISIAYYCLTNQERVKGSDDASQAKWFPVDDLPPLAFDHQKIIESALVKLRNRPLLQSNPES